MSISLTFATILTLANAADPEIVEYVKDGAIVTGLGFIQLNNPPPISIEIKNYKSCRGEVYICHKTLDSYTRRYGKCGRDGYCDLEINLETLFSWGFIENVDGDILRLDTDPDNDPKQVCPPDFKNGFHYWEFVNIPSGCEIKIIGATNPNKLPTFKLVIYILLGAAAVILLVSLGAVVFCLLRQRQNQEPKRRPRTRSPTPTNSNVNWQN